MADRVRRRKYSRTSSNSVDPKPEEPMGKPRSDSSPGGSKDPPEKKKVRPKRERWLLTRKTWRYMADAGRRLIPEGLQNRPEDVPKIEAYFQEVCQKEPRFLLWRKQSYPGAIGFRSRGRSRGGRKKIGGSCRDKTSSADEAEDIKKGSPIAGAGFTPQLTRKLGSRLDLKKLKEEFLLGSMCPSQFLPQTESREFQQPQSTLSSPEEESDLLLETLKMYLNEKPADPKTASGSKPTLNHEELLQKLREHLATIERVAAEERARSARSTSTHFEGDHMQKMLLETLRRHFGKSTNREKVISDMLTDRKSLERLYFDLRKTRGFKSGRRSGDFVHSTTALGGSYSVSRWRPPWRPSGSSSPLHYQDLQEEEGSDEEGSTDSRHVSSDPSSPPPLIEIQSERNLRSKKEKCYATQTEAIPGTVLVAIQEELKRLKIAKQEAEEKEAKEEQSQGKSYGRRSSVTDNDDVSPSVGDTIKRYLRMARKKSIDSDKADRFKRVNYDKNIRNIKAKGEITQIGDDDGLDKGIQTEESWVAALKELKLEDKPGEMSPPCEEPSSSRITSSMSSDTGVEDLYSPPQTPIPPTKSPSGILSSGQTFLSNLLHHQKARNVRSCVSTVPAVMQKSKSSSSVVHQGSRLVAKKIWKSRSKSQNRATSSATSAWTPQGNCQWTNVAGRTITISETTLLQLSDIERRVLQKVALAKLQALNLGVAVRIPSDSVATTAVQKPKRRAYLLKRKAITTGFFDSKTGKDDKEKTEGGLVFGVPLGQCIENERLARGGKADPILGNEELRRKSHHGSRSSFSSLIETTAREEKGSSESLTCADMALSMPGMLDTLSVGSALDLSQSQEAGGVPNIVTSCLRHLESYGIHTTGIFRVSSSKKRVRQLREDFDCGKDMLMDPELCPHDVATLLKEYFRDLPDSLLCKDLYPAFIQTQRIRNRRLQYEALQHLVQLLPVPNRDTLWVLLCLLGLVAKNSEDHKSISGEWVEGNKMDSNNLATLFAPNILHACKPINKDDLSAERTEERSDAINVIRALIDNYRSLYQVSAELLDEVYVHMMDSHAEALDQILQRRDLATEETEDLEASSLADDRLRVPGDSQESLVSYTVEERTSERKMWSREAFTHETAGMGGPDLEMKPRKDRGRERGSKKRWREEQTIGRRRLDSDQSTPSRRTSSTSYPDDSGCPDDPMMFRGKAADSGVITASLKIPVPSSATLIDDSDIPFIEDSERHQITLGVVRSSQRVSSDSSQASTYVQQTAQYHDSAVGSSVSPPRNSVSSYSSGGVFSSPPSWASSPPNSPDHTHTTVNYLPDEPTTARITIPTKKTPDPQQRVTVQRVTIKSAGEVQQVKQSYSRQESSSSVTTQQQVTQEQPRRRSKDFHRLTSGEQRLTTGEQLAKSASTSTVSEKTVSIVREGERTTVERGVTPSISSIGGAVLRSKTADIERMLKIQSTKQTKKSTVVNVMSEEEKKIKRKYTDSRHLTRTLPQTTESVEAESSRTEQRRSGVVWKRRELISSEPKERKGFF